MHERRKKTVAQKKNIFSAFLDGTEKLGGICITVMTKLMHFIFSITVRPIIFLFSCIVSLILRFGRYLASGVSKQLDGEKYFTGRLFRSARRLAVTLFRSPREFPSLLSYYAKRGLSRYKKVFRFALSLLIPASSFAAMLIVISVFANSNVALQINAGDEILGYVSGEEEYLEARDKAKTRLGLGAAESKNTVEMLPKITYSLALVKINEYTGSDVLCDRLIENSDANIINACGIYINGEFLCSVKNEADAKRVFNSILEEYGTDENAIVSFVQNIDYVEGLYPDNNEIMWDSLKLAKTVNSTRSANKYHTVESGESISSISDKYGLSIEELIKLNPEHTYSYSLSVGEKLLVGDAKSFLTVKVTKTEVTTETIPFKTVELQSDALYRGSTRTVLNGSNGTDQVTSLVTYIDGKKVSSEEVSRITIKEPVDKRVQVGTRAPDENYTVTPSQGGMFIWPAVNATNINSPYGYRWGRLHAGIDIGSASGTSLGKLVVAAAEGTVIVAGTHSSYGYYVRIDHGNGLQTLYAHCLAGSLMVSPGEKVYAGQPIARIGMTGYATGPHLHFEVRLNGNRINPAPYLGLK